MRGRHGSRAAVAVLLLAGCSLAPSTLAVPEPPCPRPSGGLPWWNEVVFYEIFLRSFADSDGDGVGDLAGLVDRLDYLNDGDPATSDDLGVTGIWLLPVHPSPSYHGYDVTDYRSVQPAYGSLEDFRRLLEAAHRRCMRVLIDLVLNHTSSEHPWFLASRDPASQYRNWYRWSAADPGRPNWHPEATGYYYGFFGPHMPDLNYEEPAVSEEMIEVARFWVEEVGVDGFRIDAAKYLLEDGAVTENAEGTHRWYRDFARRAKSWAPEVLLLGEVWDQTGIAARYADEGELDLTFEFSLAQAFIASARTGRSDEARRVLAAVEGAYRPQQFATFLANHDQNRVLSQLAGNEDKARLAAALLLVSPGVPFLYYGEEIGMSGVKPDERIRTPMQWSEDPNAGFTSGSPWQPLNPDSSTRSVTGQSRDPASMLSWYRDLIHLRNRHPALRHGATLPVESDAPAVFSLLRWTSEETLLIVLNLGGEALGDFRLSLEAGPLGGSYRSVPVFGSGEPPDLAATGGGGFESYRPGELPPFSAVILRLDSHAGP